MHARPAPASLPSRLLTAVLLLCALLPSGALQAKEQSYTLSSTADVNPAAMIFPYQQLLDLTGQAHGKSYTLGQLTLLNNHDVDDAPTPRLFLLSNDNKQNMEYKSSNGIYAIDPLLSPYRATTNYPAKTCSFFVLLRARCIAEKTGITKDVLRQVFDDFKDFADAQLAAAKKHYASEKRDSFAGIREYITPDELIVVFHSAELARRLAEQTSTRADGRVLRITDRRLNAIASPRAKDPFAEIHADAIECVAPWRQMEAAPEIRDGAILLQVGWISYRKTPDAPLRSEILTLALKNRK
jgi:hypothetical protein